MPRKILPGRPSFSRRSGALIVVLKRAAVIQLNIGRRRNGRESTELDCNKLFFRNRLQAYSAFGVELGRAPNRAQFGRRRPRYAPHEGRRPTRWDAAQPIGGLGQRK